LVARLNEPRRHEYGTQNRGGFCEERGCCCTTSWRCFTCRVRMCYEHCKMHARDPKIEGVYVGHRGAPVPQGPSPMELYGDLGKASPATLALLASAERAYRERP
jgi:hypothetical protein